MPLLTPHDIVDHVNGMADTGRAGMAATALMEVSEGFGGPYSDQTRDYIERWLSDECSINRIVSAVGYATRMMDLEGEFALSTDDGENLIDDDEELMETYRG